MAGAPSSGTSPRWFDFGSRNTGVVSLPSTAGYAPPDLLRHDDYSPVPPTVQSLPKQEPGMRPARAVPYELHVEADADPSEGSVRIAFSNTGKSAAVFQVRSGNSDRGPWTHTVGASDRLSDKWAVRSYGQSEYDLSVYGPNGFFRAYEGSILKNRGTPTSRFEPAITRMAGLRSIFTIAETKVRTSGSTTLTAKPRPSITLQPTELWFGTGTSTIRTAGMI